MRVVCDQRETRAGVVRELDRLGCDVHLATMEVGDYVVSDRVAFERKDIDDFMNSWLIEKKLFGQISDLAHSYERPVLIIEGGDPFFTGRQVSPMAVQGLLNTIACSFRVPILYSNNVADTARIICMIGKHEQNDKKRIIQLHGKRSHLSQNEIKEYVLSSVPDIGRNTAISLLRAFGTLQNIFNADVDKLQTVDGVGEKTAKRIYDTVRGVYFGRT